MHIAQAATESVHHLRAISVNRSLAVHVYHTSACQW